MKKILSITSLIILLLSFKAYSQSNLTWTIKDQLEKGGIKTATVFNSNFAGFTSKQEAIAFSQKLKASQEIVSCDIISNSGTNCDIKLVMKQPHDKRYYAGFAAKMGISYIQVNGTKKTPAQWLEKKNKK
jgi:uncharacterized protein (DUF2141 family)